MSTIPTEEESNADTAAELILLQYDTDGTPSGLMIHDENYILDDIDRSFALALAERLLHLAQSLPDPRQILQRHRMSPEQVAEAAKGAEREHERRARWEKGLSEAQEIADHYAKDENYQRLLRRGPDVDAHLRALDD